ncbi:C-C motif chemokine 36.1 [Fundulus heteroclitus]|uniref:Eotaxin-like n=1 Tax=Fundulus heteroclitus TaxID=8078 RepID=A0A3Q2TTF1_FUNHE|nr:C-C motif chemokine 36.1 [Fundulus heteroclitus]
MKATSVFLLCILGAALLSTVLCQNGIGPDNCCFKFYPRRVKRDLIRSYNFTDHRCPKAGAIFVTVKNNQNICVDPSLAWVENTMKYLDEKNLQ